MQNVLSGPERVTKEQSNVVASTFLFTCPFAVNRKKELKNLYGRIAEKFPFLAKQGLKGDSLDDLFGMTIFGQPKAGK